MTYITIQQHLFAQDLFKDYPVYHGNDLGLVYTKVHSSFRCWSPTASEAQIWLYKNNRDTTPYQTIDLQKADGGTWHIQLSGDWKGYYYTVRVKINNNWSQEVTDPYAKMVGLNGKKAYVGDWKIAQPDHWNKDVSPDFSTTNAPTDAVIYELHIRDASIAKGSGIIHKGKFLGLTERGTVQKNGLSTGLDHLKELGVTHIHLLPFFDFNSVNEAFTDSLSYNWGYDPLNYNVPEGSYSTHADNPIARITELKQMIAALHKNGLRVIMDVVFNHTALRENSSFNQLVPGYYYRHNNDGKFSDATACGNEIASELPMVRKFMLESLLFWMKEYHIDGFRFDLMGVHDIHTMNIIADSLHAIRPDLILYGEGWTAGKSPMPDSQRALKANVAQLHQIAVFNDDLRDGIKGSVFEAADKGFVSGKIENTASVQFGIAAACHHPQIKYDQVNYSKAPYAISPSQVINYCECHDNHTLWDKLSLSNPLASKAQLKKMHLMALTIVLTSQGIPFLHAGTEMLRSKKDIENSYNAGDKINQIDWDKKSETKDVFNYVKQLIAVRKHHPMFRMTNSGNLAAELIFDDHVPAGTIGYTLTSQDPNEKWASAYVFFNGTAAPCNVSLPKGLWKTAMNDYEFPEAGKVFSGYLMVKSNSSVILYQDKTDD